MKTLSRIILLLLLSFSCTKKEYRYEIHGKIYVPTSGLSGLHDAVWYADSIDYSGDTLFYINSDGTRVNIRPPYKLIDHKNKK